MRNLILTLGLAILFSSCSSTYFLTTINTDNTQTKKNENGSFTIENDSLQIIYSFNGKNAPIKITISNKLDKMLHIDWQKSAIALNNEAFSYVGENINFTGHAKEVWANSPYIYNVPIEGSFKLPANITSIPPKSWASETPITLKKLSFDQIDKKAYHKFLMQNKNDETIEVDRIDFSAQDTPFYIRSYLVLYYNESKPFIIEQDFYVENIMKTKSLSPQEMPDNLAKRGDFFYMEKKPNSNIGNYIAWGSVIIVSGVVLLIAL